MRVGWNLAHNERVRLLATRLALLDLPCGGMDGRPALQVWQREGRPAVAAVRGAEQRE